MISIKIHDSGERQLLAACDEELLGKTFTEGDLTLEISKFFYGGETIDIEKFAELIKKSTLSNIAGEQAVNKAIEIGIVLKDSVITVQGIPHAQIVKV